MPFLNNCKKSPTRWAYILADPYKWADFFGVPFSPKIIGFGFSSPRHKWSYKNPTKIVGFPWPSFKGLDRIWSELLLKETCCVVIRKQVFTRVHPAAKRGGLVLISKDMKDWLQDWYWKHRRFAFFCFVFFWQGCLVVVLTMLYKQSLHYLFTYLFPTL